MSFSEKNKGCKQNDHFQVQHMAVACIQKNVKKFMAIREWPWWRLYVKVKPLLNVHRTEEELKNKDVRSKLVLIYFNIPLKLFVQSFIYCQISW